MKHPLFIMLLVMIFHLHEKASSQEIHSERIVVLHDSLITGSVKRFYLPELEGWKFSPEDHPSFSSPSFDDSGWYRVKGPLTTKDAVPDSLWNGFGWFRLKVKLDSTFFHRMYLQSSGGAGAVEFYVNDSLVFTRGVPAPLEENQLLDGWKYELGTFIELKPGETYQLAIKYSFHNYAMWSALSLNRPRNDFDIVLTAESEKELYINYFKSFAWVIGAALAVLFLVMALHYFLYRRTREKDANYWIFLMTASIFFIALLVNLDFLGLATYLQSTLVSALTSLASSIAIGLIPLAIHRILEVDPGKIWRYFIIIPLIEFFLLKVFGYFFHLPLFVLQLSSLALLVIALFGGARGIIKAKRKKRKDLWLIGSSLIAFPLLMIIGILFINILKIESLFFMMLIFFLLFTIIPIGMSLYQGKKFLNMHTRLDQMVGERTMELEQAMKNLRQSHQNLKAAQNQLVQQEKLASLGQLTAGIAHEIKNPLNFVTNFSDVCLELIEEAKMEIRTQKKTLVRVQPENNGESSFLENLNELLETVELNLQKIYQHGTRADGIVKSMLLHSRGGTGKRELTNLNTLVKEYVNLAYHGMRASKNPVEVKIELELDETIDPVPLIAEDFSRVILNLCNNAFDAMREKMAESEFNAVLKVSTEKFEDRVKILIKDNGPGIKQEIMNNILQPFFTTKKGTDGTGLGLSLTNEIVKAHGGEIRVESQPGTGAAFSIILPYPGNSEIA